MFFCFRMSWLHPPPPTLPTSQYRQSLPEAEFKNTYNFFEDSRHNLESSQTQGMDFLNHREGGVVLYQFFLLSPLQYTVAHNRNCKRLREFEEKEISMQSCRSDCEQQGGKLLCLQSGFHPRIQLLLSKENKDLERWGRGKRHCRCVRCVGLFQHIPFFPARSI